MSDEAASKWLHARSIPDQTNLARVAADLNVTPQWLQAGQQPKRPPDFDSTSTDIVDVVRALEPDERAEVLRYARYRAGLSSQ